MDGIERSAIRRKACDYIGRNPQPQVRRHCVNHPSDLISLCEQSLTCAPSVVLDTNVVLDWLLFADPATTAIAVAVSSGRVRWIATAAMRSEFTHVLHRGLATARGIDPATLLDAWASRCNEVSDPPRAPALLRCTDAGDQMFIDLALAAGARWLVSRDRAVLKLRRRAALLGLAIAPPHAALH
jgi:predicted nucleic acid-binding protein